MAKKNKILVDNANKLHKSLTVILGTLLTVVSFLEMHQDTISNLLQSVIPADKFPLISGILGFLIVVGRYIKQPGLQNVEKKN